MATSIGKDGAVYVDSQTSAVAEVRDWSLETTSEVVNDTVMGDTWMTNKATQKSWTASVNCYWSDGDTTGQDLLVEGAAVTLKLYPEGNTSGNTYWYGDVIITSVSKSLSFDGLVEISFSATGNGALTEGSV
jgi:hypothetical protein